jgi:hypothetical protein
MMTVKFNKQPPKNYYNFTLISLDKSHFLNIYISKEDDNIWLSISKSDDGFYFKSPCEEASDLNIDISENIEETYNTVKNHFLNKRYSFIVSK